MIIYDILENISFKKNLILHDSSSSSEFFQTSSPAKYFEFGEFEFDSASLLSTYLDSFNPHIAADKLIAKLKETFTFMI